MQLALLPRSLALFNAGSRIAARIAIMAMTTNSSISVNALRLEHRFAVRGTALLCGVFPCGNKLKDVFMFSPFLMVV